MCPRSGFRSRRTCECTLVPVFVPGQHPNVPSFRFCSGGTSAKTTLLENHPFGSPREGGVQKVLSTPCWRVQPLKPVPYESQEREINEEVLMRKFSAADIQGSLLGRVKLFKHSSNPSPPTLRRGIGLLPGVETDYDTMSMEIAACSTRSPV